MDLFSQQSDYPDNLLPKDGEVKYFGQALSFAEADSYLASFLKTIQWRNDEAVVLGKSITTKRKVAWYAEQPFEYTYSNVTKRALLFTPELLTLKEQVQQLTGERYNACLLNLYHNGSEGMSWHSDGEKDLKRNGAIASVSLGAERKFSFKHKRTKEKVSLVLQHGSVLVMKGVTQAHWLHQLPTTTRVDQARVNLTFRTIEV